MLSRPEPGWCCWARPPTQHGRVCREQSLKLFFMGILALQGSCNAPYLFKSLLSGSDPSPPSPPPSPRNIPFPSTSKVAVWKSYSPAKEAKFLFSVWSWTSLQFFQLFKKCKMFVFLRIASLHYILGDLSSFVIALYLVYCRGPASSSLYVQIEIISMLYITRH